MKQPNLGKSHHVYVIELKPSLLGKERITEANPGYRYREDRPLLYVGMTGRTPGIRYAQHLRGYKASKYTRTNCVRLRPDLYDDLNPMSREEAVSMEVNLAERLRKKGFAVWQN